MVIELSQLMGAVDRVRDIVADSKNENISVLMKCDKANGKVLIAFADGHKAVCSEIEAHYDAEEVVEEELVASFKQVSEAIDIIKPSGIVCVDDVSITMDTEKKQINFAAEKYINVAEDENAEEATRQTISVMSRTFAYIRMEDDKRQRILKCVDYASMLTIGTAESEEEAAKVDNWNRTEFINTLVKMTTEDAMVIISGKSKNVRVANTSYAVSIPREDIKVSLCLPTKTAKYVMAVLRHCGSDTIDIKVDENSAIVCSDDAKVAMWFETAKPLSRVINILNAYAANTYDSHQLVVIRDAIVNQIKCLGDDATNVEFTFEGDGVEGYTMNIGGGNSTTKTSKFNLALSGVSGDCNELLGRKFTTNCDTLKNMLALCDTNFVGLEFGTQDNVWVLRVCEISKSAGVVERFTECYTMTTMSAK